MKFHAFPISLRWSFEIVAMAYVRVIPETIELLFEYLPYLLLSILLFSNSIISFSQVFCAFLLGVCVASFLFDVDPPRIWCCQQIRKKIFFPDHFVLSWTILSKKNGNEFKGNTVKGTLRFGAAKL